MLEQGAVWDIYLSLIEFVYNNIFYFTIRMAPFEVLYGRRCSIPLCWYDFGESVAIGPKFMQQKFENIKIIQ